MNKVLITLFMVLICSPAWSATQLKKTVCPSGCDYTSLEAAMNANEQNLVTADKYFDVEISGTWSSADTTAVTIHNYTTDATRYINIYTTGDARHDGREASVSGRSNYRLQRASSGFMGIRLNSGNVKIDGLEISGWKSDYDSTGGIYADFVGGIQVSNCIIFNIGIGADRSGHAIVFYYGGNKAFNNIIYKTRSDGISLSGTYTGANDLFNNTIYNYNVSNVSGVGIRGTSNSGNIKNNLVIAGANGGYCYTFGTQTTATNASSDTTGDIDNLTTSEFVSVGTTTVDLHLAVGATSIDAGTDLGSPYNIDIDGTTRTGTWDIGADEMTASAPASITHTFGNITVLSGSGTITF